MLEKRWKTILLEMVHDVGKRWKTILLEIDVFFVLSGSDVFFNFYLSPKHDMSCILGRSKKIFFMCHTLHKSHFIMYHCLDCTVSHVCRDMVFVSLAHD